MFYVCLDYTAVSVPCSHVITCWEKADLLALLCAIFPGILSLYHILSLVGYGTLLYRFLINALFFTFLLDRKDPFFPMCF